MVVSFVRGSSGGSTSTRKTNRYLSSSSVKPLSPNASHLATMRRHTRREGESSIMASLKTASRSKKANAAGKEPARQGEKTTAFTDYLLARAQAEDVAAYARADLE